MFSGRMREGSLNSAVSVVFQQHISDYNMHTDHLGVLLKRRFGVSKLGGAEALHFKPGLGGAAFAQQVGRAFCVSSSK